MRFKKTLPVMMLVWYWLHVAFQHLRQTLA